ncbi:MAG: hypothetical protein HKM04_02020 [Legionellales bacterium]|nr:hypothetical protein [Legionellales bacterium]
MSKKPDIIETPAQYERCEALFLSCLKMGHFDIRETKATENNEAYYSILIRTPQKGGQHVEIMLPQYFLDEYYNKNLSTEEDKKEFLETLPKQYQDYFVNSLDDDKNLNKLKVIRDATQKNNLESLQKRKNQESILDPNKYQQVTPKEMEGLTPLLISQIKNGKLDIRQVTLRPRTLRPGFLDPKPFDFELKKKGVILLPPNKNVTKPRYILASDLKNWYDKLPQVQKEEINQDPSLKEYFASYAAKDTLFTSLIGIQQRNIKSSGTSFNPVNFSSQPGQGYLQSAASAQGLYTARAPLTISPSLVTQLAEDSGWTVAKSVEPNTSTGEAYRIVNEGQNAVKVYDKKVGIDNPTTRPKAAMAAQIAAKVPGTEAIIVSNNRNDLQSLINAFEAVIAADKLPIVESVGTALGIPPRTQDEVVSGLSVEGRNKLSELINAAPQNVRDNYFRTTQAKPIVPTEPEKPSNLSLGNK